MVPDALEHVKYWAVLAVGGISNCIRAAGALVVAVAWGSRCGPGIGTGDDIVADIDEDACGVYAHWSAGTGESGNHCGPGKCAE